MSRIIAGSARGLKLDIFPRLNMRPTSNRVKEALFDIIQFDIKGKTFLDLFSGTGQISLEALSRGASKVYALDNSFESSKIIKKNINIYKRNSKCDCNIDFFYYDSFKFLKDFNSKVDILFADAPFDMEISKEIFEKFERVTNNIIITETLYKNIPVNGGTMFNLIKRYRYGRVSLNLYKNNKM